MELRSDKHHRQAHAAGLDSGRDASRRAAVDDQIEGFRSLVSDGRSLGVSARVPVNSELQHWN